MYQLKGSEGQQIWSEHLYCRLKFLRWKRLAKCGIGNPAYVILHQTVTGMNAI